MSIQAASQKGHGVSVRSKLFNRILSGFLLTCLGAVTAVAQSDWPTYGGDAGSTRYSPLKQIDMKNVGTLTKAWTYHMTAPDYAARWPVRGKAKWLTPARQALLPAEPRCNRRQRGGRGGARVDLVDAVAVRRTSQEFGAQRPS